MAQPNEVPRFKGDEEPEEAEKWLEILVESTGSFSDTGIFRLLGMRFPTGSPAQEWFNSLEAGTKASWEAFKQAFHSRWIDTAERIRKQRAWEAFAHHSLSDDTIFSGRDFNYENSCNILRLWAEEHLRLWQKTDSDDEVLVETTKGLLPSFILAYFRAYLQDRQFSNLVELCSEVSSLPSQILLFEHTRRQLASMEKIVSMEKQINVVSEKVDKIMNMISEGGLNISVPSLPGPLNQPSGHLDRSGDPVISSNESIHWEQSSPLTSVASIGDPEATPISEVSTPIAPPILLSNQIEGDQSSLLGPEENIVSGIVVELEPSLQVPREWRKPFRTKSTKELIELARRVMAFATYTRNASGVYYEQFNIFNSAMAVFDRLTESTLRVTGDYWKPGKYYNNYHNLLHAIDLAQSYHTHERYSHLSESISSWSYITSKNFSDGTWKKLDQTNIYISNTGNWYNVSPDLMSLSNAPWGVCHVDSGGYLVLSSVQTILFMVLSSYLAECTGESKYKEAAINAAAYIKTWLLDSETSLVKDRSLHTRNAKEAYEAVLSCHLTGLVIEGFCVLSSITGDTEWNTLAIDISRSAMDYGEWHSSDGILVVGTDGDPSEDTFTKTMKGLLNRGLMYAYQRNRSNKPFCDLIRSYINVQFNALYDLSRMRSTYGVDWRGPYVGPYVHAQIAAFDTIVATIAVNDKM